MLTRCKETEPRRDCSCGCRQYAEPPTSCAVCDAAWVADEHVACSVLSRSPGTVMIHQRDMRYCPNRGKRKDCPLRHRHAEELRYV